MLTPPSLPTLIKYGLTPDSWLAIAGRQHGLCPVCERPLEGLKVHVDHVHVKGFKRLPRGQRPAFVRGLLCSHCNSRLLPRGMTLAKARGVVAYLEAFESRALIS